jgi:predicted Zn-dependent protease
VRAIDPHEAINLWQKMMAAEKSETPQFRSTHPALASRIADLESHMPQVLPLYLAAAPKGNSAL